MRPSRWSFARPQVLRVQMYMTITVVLLASWQMSSDATSVRCSTDLLSDIMFVCGDRGTYSSVLSGHAAAQYKGRGIVDRCCRPPGCDLHHLERYCAKPKDQQSNTAYPTTSTITTTKNTTAQMDMEQQFQAVFHKRLVEHLGGPDSQKRNVYRKKTQPSESGQKKRKSSNRRRSKVANPSSRPPTISWSPAQGAMAEP